MKPLSSEVPLSCGSRYPACTLLLSVLLSACSPDPGESTTEPASTENSAATASAEIPAAPATTPIPALPVTVNELMRTMIDPNAKALWGAVSYVATPAGETETMPQTDAEWEALRNNAIALIQAGDTLKLPGQNLATPDPAVPYPDYLFMPAEIETLIRSDDEGWRLYIQDMQTAVLETMDAINRKDVLRLTESSVTINQACEGCHAQFWYRPAPMQTQP